MKIATTTFLCDTPGCREQVTVFEDSKDQNTAAYLDLVGKGWTVKRPLSTGWKHYCPTHPDGGGA